ncbi:Tn3 family transposase [Streptomyces sp. NPDC004542]|uniref:Tn3 family transposase n=1 Tax=Streptomyces sp. NPDC004542 TaxID=3154281 RepID=UPI0033B61899
MISWHVERRSVCIYSRLKSCSPSEVASMIERVLRHCTDPEVDRQHTDTHGASIVGFAFARMLDFTQRAPAVVVAVPPGVTETPAMAYWIRSVCV